MDYPFIPKSNTKLLPGDFWAVPLEDGTFGCGLVFEKPPTGMPGSKVSFLGGLLDWHGCKAPVEAELGKRKALQIGIMHVMAINETGGQVLGRIQPWWSTRNPFLVRNGNDLSLARSATRLLKGKLPWSCENLSWWGYDVIQVLANRKFVRNDPIELDG